MSYQDLVIINNERISKEKTDFYCENIDIKSIPEDLNKNFNVTLVVRRSKNKEKTKINLQKIKTSSNLFVFLYNIFKTFKKKKYYLFSNINNTLHFFFISSFIFF